MLYLVDEYVTIVDIIVNTVKYPKDGAEMPVRKESELVPAGEQPNKPAMQGNGKPVELQDIVGDSLTMYFYEMGQIALLSVEEEEALGHQIQKGDTEAQKRMVEANLRLAASRAWRYGDSHMDRPDIIQEGNLGLMRAASDYDPRKGRFTTYADPWIHQAIRRALSRKGRPIRVPEGKVNDMLKVLRLSGQLAMDLGREPSDEELTAASGLTLKELIEAREIIQQQNGMYSLDAQLGDDDDDTFGDLLASESHIEMEKAVMSRALKEDLNRLLKKILTPREQEAVRMHFDLDGQGIKTFREIGEQYNVSGERARVIVTGALKKLRDHGSAKALQEYLN